MIQTRRVVKFKTSLFNNVYSDCVIETPHNMGLCTFENCIFLWPLKHCNIRACSFKNCTYSNEDYHDAIKHDIVDRVCEGDIIGYKKAYLCDKDLFWVDDVIVKLMIPVKAKRINGNSNKCRAEYAKVLEMYDTSHIPISIAKGYKVHSIYDDDFRYIKGRIVKPDYFDETKKVCTGGIHFFKTFEEAKNYF